MDFRELSDLTLGVKEHASKLGFDLLQIKAVEKTALAVRIANSTPCRENILHHEQTAGVYATKERRTSNLQCLPNQSALERCLSQVREEIMLYAPNMEYCHPASQVGEHQIGAIEAQLTDILPPADVYALIERHLAKVRKRKLRVTGYLEASQMKSQLRSSNDYHLQTQGRGLTLKLMVDNPATGATGAGVGALVVPNLDELDRLAERCLDEAVRVCMASSQRDVWEPGKYTVILAPAAVRDLIDMACVYGLFDRRKIDEGRTFLSGKIDHLRFPQGLCVHQPINLPLPGGTVQSSPFNAMGVRCSSLKLVNEGRLCDLVTEPFWSRKQGIEETFQRFDAPPTYIFAQDDSPLAGVHKSLKDLIEGTERGILVNHLWYLRMVAEMDGMLTGMTRDGVFEIQDGKIGRSLCNMRWHENPITALQRVTGMTEEKQVLGMSPLASPTRDRLAVVPSLRIEDFRFSSPTRF